MVLNFTVNTWIRTDRLAMLIAKRSAGVAPEVNLRNLLLTGDEARDPLWLSNPEQMLPEVQNRGVSGPTKRTYVLLIGGFRGCIPSWPNCSHFHAVFRKIGAPGF